MTTVVYQGTKSLDTRFLESTMLKLKVPHPFAEVPETQPMLDGSWASIQSLFSSTTTCPKLTESYPASLSLETCTETLGDENGSDFCNSNTLYLFPSVEEIQPVKQRAVSTSCQVETTKVPKTRHRRTACDFPPPLSSLSGPNRVRLTARRENGKLLMEAVETSESPINVERTEGRIVMSVMVEPDFIDATIRDTNSDSSPCSSNVCGHVESEEFREIKCRGKDENDDVDIILTTEIGWDGYRRPSRCKDGNMKKPFVLHRFWVST